jgi:protein disulfide-isomerase A1
LDPSTHANFKKIDDIVVISYLGSAQVKELGMIRSIAEKHYESFVFGYVTDERVADAEGLAVPAVISYKNTDGDNKAMNGDFNEEDLELFLEMAKKSVIGEFSERTMNDYMAVRGFVFFLSALRCCQLADRTNRKTSWPYTFSPQRRMKRLSYVASSRLLLRSMRSM